MGTIFYFNWEVSLMQAIQSINNSILTLWAGVLSELGDQYGIILILGFLYWGSNKKWGKYMLLCMAPAQIISPMLKSTVCRLRPYMVHSDVIKCLKPVDSEYDIYDIVAQGYSFPSMHSSSSVAVYSALAIYNHKYGQKKIAILILGIVMPLLIGLSRIYLGVHYPTDVLVGWIFGAVTLFIMDYLYGKLSNISIVYLAIALIGFAGIFFCDGNDFYTSYGMIVGGFVSALFEERFVKFKNTRNFGIMVLRTLGGVVIYLVVNTVLKLPFSSEFLSSGTKLAQLVRLVRYFINTFIMIGLYPMSFKYFDGLFNKSKKN